ncbi:MAG: two-component system response regulator KdpE [Herpetosiphon sp.]
MTSIPPIVVCIEDEPQIRRFLRTTLAGHGYTLVEAATARAGLAAVAQQRPVLVILDLGLPDMDGLDVIRELRGWSTVPILVLSASGQERDKVTVLDAGADDYLTKPFGVDELLARMRVALRHAARTASGTTDPIFTVGDLHIDLARRQVMVGTQEVHLTPIEHKLLATLVHHAGKVLTHHQLLQAVWGPGYTAESHYLRVYMANLRRKLEADSARPRYLQTEPGVGYRLRADLA